MTAAVSERLRSWRGESYSNQGSRGVCRIFYLKSQLGARSELIICLLLWWPFEVSYHRLIRNETFQYTGRTDTVVNYQCNIQEMFSDDECMVIGCMVPMPPKQAVATARQAFRTAERDLLIMKKRQWTNVLG